MFSVLWLNKASGSVTQGTMDRPGRSFTGPSKRMNNVSNVLKKSLSCLAMVVAIWLTIALGMMAIIIFGLFAG